MISSNCRVFVILVLISSLANAADLVVRVKRSDGTPVAQAVVIVDADPAKHSSKPRPESIVDQIDRQFAPHVAIVRTGTTVRFPNHDNIRHHVYSFSKAKTFELPLYKGTPADPVKFDMPGIVTMACNIHDWMLGYVYVTDAEWFAVTGTDGIARIKLPEHDKYKLTVWHPDMGPDTSGQSQPLVREGRAALDVSVLVAPGKARAVRRLRRSNDRYN